jgi:hypothetical protein
LEVAKPKTKMTQLNDKTIQLNPEETRKQHLPEHTGRDASTRSATDSAGA